MRSIFTTLLRAGFVLLGASWLGGCASLYLTQEPDAMLVRLGDRRELRPAARSADLFLDYALLADQTYADALYPPRNVRPFAIGDATYCAGRTRPEDGCRDVAGLTDYARRRLARWQLVYAEKDLERFPCPAGRADCGTPVGGLGVQVWMRRGRVCPEAVIAFRGTDGQSADDWASNLRWLLRLLPLYDQYDQVEAYAPAFVGVVERQPCFRRGWTRIMAIGHSLGGGLAQNAAVVDGRIRGATVFDPSVVTGISDLPDDLRRANERDLPIERVYEHGEILAYPRFVLRQFVPYSTCDPRIRTVRLNTIRGSPIAQHSLASMATALLGWSRDERAAGRRADAPLVPDGPIRCDDTGVAVAKVY